MVTYGKIGSWNVMLEDGYVLRACHDSNEGVWCYPYVRVKSGGWDDAYNCLTLASAKERFSHGTLIFH